MVSTCITSPPSSPTPPSLLTPNQKIFLSNLDLAIFKAGSRQKLSDLLDIKKSTISMWYTNKHTPRGSNLSVPLSKLSKYLNTTVVGLFNIDLNVNNDNIKTVNNDTNTNNLGDTTVATNNPINPMNTNTSNSATTNSSTTITNPEMIGLPLSLIHGFKEEDFTSIIQHNISIAISKAGSTNKLLYTLKISYPTLAYYKAGYLKSITTTLISLAKYLNVSTSTLVTKKLAINNINESNPSTPLTTNTNNPNNDNTTNLSSIDKLLLLSKELKQLSSCINYYSSDLFSNLTRIYEELYHLFNQDWTKVKEFINTITTLPVIAVEKNITNNPSNSNNSNQETTTRIIFSPNNIHHYTKEKNQDPLSMLSKLNEKETNK